MSRRAQENLAAVVLIAVFAGVAWMSLDFGPRARMIPLPLALLGVALTLVQLVWQNVSSTDSLQMEMISVDQPDLAAVEDAPAQPAPQKTQGWRREMGAFGMVVLFLALMLALGPMTAVFVFTAGYFVLTRQYSWKTGLLGTALFTGSVFLLFSVALGVQPYHGLLAPLFG